MGLELGKAYVRVRADSERLAQDLHQAEGLVSNSMEGMRRSIAAVTGALSFFGIMSLRTGTRLAGTFEQTMISFETMLGSAKETEKTMAALTKFAIVTPYEMPGILQAARGLIMFGERGEELMGTLKMLGDAASGTSTPFGFLALVFNQIRGVGRLLTQDFRQLSTRGVLNLQDIADYYGVATDAAQKMLSTGRISFEDVKGIFRKLTSEGGRFANMMEKQSVSFEGLKSTLSDALNIMKRVIAVPFVKGVLKPMLKASIGVADVMGAVVQKVPELASAFAVLTASLTTLTAGYYGAGLAAKYFKVSMAGLLLPVKRLWLALGGLALAVKGVVAAAGLAGASFLTLTGIGAAVGLGIVGLGAMFKWLLGPSGLAGEGLEKVKEGADDVKEALEEAKPAVDAFTKAIEKLSKAQAERATKRMELRTGLEESLATVMGMDKPVKKLKALEDMKTLISDFGEKFVERQLGYTAIDLGDMVTIPEETFAKMEQLKKSLQDLSEIPGRLGYQAGEAYKALDRMSRLQNTIARISEHIRERGVISEKAKTTMEFYLRKYKEGLKASRVELEKLKASQVNLLEAFGSFKAAFDFIDRTKKLMLTPRDVFAETKSKLNLLLKAGEIDPLEYAGGMKKAFADLDSALGGPKRKFKEMADEIKRMRAGTSEEIWELEKLFAAGKINFVELVKRTEQLLLFQRVQEEVRKKAETKESIEFLTKEMMTPIEKLKDWMQGMKELRAKGLSEETLKRSLKKKMEDIRGEKPESAIAGRVGFADYGRRIQDALMRKDDPAKRTAINTKGMLDLFKVWFPDMVKAIKEEKTGLLT